MNKIFSAQKDIIENFKLLDEWEDKYAYLLELGDRNISSAPELKVKTNLVSGCQSNVWIVEKLEKGLIHFNSDSDAPIPKALAAVMSKILSGNKPQEVVNAEINFHLKTDLIHYLSPTRVRGLESMIGKFKKLSLKYLKNDMGI